MRSTRYSLTARGRRVAGSSRAADRQQFLRKRQRLNAAALARRRDDAPHFRRSSAEGRSAVAGYAASSMFSSSSGRTCGGVLRPACARARRARCGASSSRTARQRLQRIGGVARHQDLLPGLERNLEPLPAVAEHGGAAGGGFEEAPGRAVAHVRHGAARDIQGEARGAVEGRVLAGGKWRTKRYWRATGNRARTARRR